MRNCDSVRAALLEGDRSDEVRQHASHCEACSAFAARALELDTRLRFDVDVDGKYVEFRKRLILQKLPSTGQLPAHYSLLRALRVSLAAAAIIVLAGIPFRNRTPDLPLPSLSASAAQEEVPFELQKSGDQVELRWKGDPGRAYRIYKGPNPGSMKPVQMVRGKEWVDRSADSSPIIFYKVEPM